MENVTEQPSINPENLIPTIDNEIANSISLSESLKGDSLALIATIFALIGIIGISAIKELLLVWVASSFLLITLIFLKILKDQYPSKKNRNNFEHLLSHIGENERETIILQMVSATSLNNLKPLYKSLILIFITDLLIFLISSAGLIPVTDFGFPILGFIVIVLVILTILSLNLAKVGSSSIAILGKLAEKNMKNPCEGRNKNLQVIPIISYVFLLIPLIVLGIVLLLVNNVVPFIGNFPNLCKICILMILQIIFIAIFCEFFNKQMISQMLSKKIARLNSLKLLIFYKAEDRDNPIKEDQIRYMFKFSNIFVVQKEQSFFFFEKNSLKVNIGVILVCTEEELKKLLNDELDWLTT